MSEIEVVKDHFVHRQYAHCESGVSSNLIQHAGPPVSEAMAFGVGSGIFFGHMPFVKIMGLPLTTYRSLPTTIFKKCCKRLALDYKYKKFSNPEKGKSFLDALLKAKKIVALQTNIYWLPYMPERFRFPFNAHNIIVFNKTDELGYEISDPILEGTAACPVEDMQKARFAKGPLSPKGFLYYIDQNNCTISDQQFRKGILAGLKESCHRMLYIPVPFFGHKAISYLAKQIRKWFQKNDARRFSLLVTHVVRMQEEIGTGGAGFRFLFARFLEEAAQYFPNSNEGNVLAESSKEFLKIGDQWRQWASTAVKTSKNKEELSLEKVETLCALLEEIHTREYAAFKRLHREFVLTAKKSFSL